MVSIAAISDTKFFPQEDLIVMFAVEAVNLPIALRRDVGFNDRASRDIPFNDRPPRDVSYNDRPPPRRDDYPSRSYGRDNHVERPMPPRREHEKAPPSEVLGVFGLSVQTRETHLDYEFSRFGTVESVNIVYDQRTERSRGFGFIRMSTTAEAEKCIENLNGMDLQGRRIRVDFSTTNRPHNPTPGAYMGQRRPAYDDREVDRPRYGSRDGRDDRGVGGGRSYNDRPPMNRDYDHYDGGSRILREAELTGTRGIVSEVLFEIEKSAHDESEITSAYFDSLNQSSTSYIFHLLLVSSYRAAPGRRTSASPPPRERDPRADRSFRTYDDAPPAGGDMRY
ncbi:hypothetical protein QFC21_002380 [Naganishia friedmannii]|uniref:Uncharacterized protein n=1 Tax=Naganishia friedmannii TaxID=89922 RepID=A0ACC2VYF5_9TREE|nr:hypothetical protein QFC21_002380 [Naganishia friedmannii]